MEAYPNTSEDPVVRQKFAENIFQILRPLSASEMPRIRRRRPNDDGDDDDNDGESSECSALSDPFSDLDESYIMLDQRKKVSEAVTGDELLLMNQFTPEFRSAYDVLMSERRLQNPTDAGQKQQQQQQQQQQQKKEKKESGVAASTGHSDDLRVTADFSPKFRSFIDEMLRKCDLQYHQEEKKRKELQQRKKDRRVRQIVSEESFCGGLDTDSLSGIWRMLDAVSEDERDPFPTSGPHYDLYYDRRFAWMTRDEIAWEQIEESKKKCEQWLKLPFENGTTRP
ncbi:putative uncharacterized protein DDB_G0274435 [Anopheles darlingi]|uniref:putative uncharacterized protein DDB_G0274435 n=1 Tax=Anopheles darlingi TaxID=43151 RepID=UPI0020FFFE46|nr:putative uncharacterized protein DDB_G0274435 [Anopheles darlingi]